MTARDGIWWLASYPRSGNTWVRVMLYAYFHGPPQRSRDIAAFIPDLHSPGELDPGDGGRAVPRFAKTHWPWSPSHPAADLTAGAVVITRHPRDVLLSCLDYHRVLGTTTSLGPLQDREFCRLFIESGGDPVWISQGLGTWAEFHASWLDAPAHPRLVIRYDELKRDAAAALARILTTVGEPPDAPRIQAAVRAASFDNMRALEVREKSKSDKPHTFFGGRPQTYRKGHLFMKSARLGARLEPIAPGLDKAFDASFAAAIARFP